MNVAHDRLRGRILPSNEIERLKELASYRVMDTPDEADFQAIVEVASHIAGVPMALISLLDENRQWFKARVGLGATETPREISFCQHVVASGEPIVVEDATADDRFRANPLVTGDPNLRFYAGMPLETESGAVLGTLCVLDRAPGTLSDRQKELLAGLATQVMGQLNLRRTAYRLSENQHRLRNRNLLFEIGLTLQCTIGDNMCFQDVNPAWESILGWTRAELSAVPWTEFVHPKDLARTVAETRSVMNFEGVVESFVNRYRHKEGRWVPLSWKMAKLDGLLYGAAIDISDQWGREEEARHLARVIECSEDAIFTEALEGTVLSWNAAASRMFGYNEAQALGMKVETLGLETRPLAKTKSRISVPIIVSAEIYDATCCRQDGTGFDASVSVSPVYGQDGEMTGWSRIVRDVSAQKQLQRIQKQFVSTVSHELRTPLTSIRGALGLLEGGVVEPGSAQAKALVAVAASNTDRLSRLVNDILDLERIAAGKMEVRFADVDPKEVVDAVIHDVGTLTNETEVLILALPTAGVTVWADADRVIQVLTNFVSNAIKFSPKTEPVEVTVEETQSWVRFSVRDHGPGVPAGFSDRLFEPFAQADGSATRTTQGSGLGLSISKRLTELMHGRIGWSSADGGGTVFYCELPRFAPSIAGHVP